MKSLRNALFLVAAISLVAEARWYIRQQETIRQLQSTRQALATLHPKPPLNEGRRDAETTTTGGGQVPAPAAGGSPEAASAQRWVTDLEMTEDYFLKHPDAWIPELALLNDKAMLTALKDADLSTDAGRRTALAKLRREAKDAFVLLTQKALSAYLMENGNELPTDPVQLAPYGDPTVTVEMLSRYRMAVSGSMALVPSSTWALIEESAPAIDPEYEAQAKFGPITRSVILAAGSATNKAFGQAMNAYQKDHGTVAALPDRILRINPGSLDDLRPYLPTDGLDEEHLKLLFQERR